MKWNRFEKQLVQMQQIFIYLVIHGEAYLGMEYALKYQDNMKALIVANMVASAPEYGKYAAEVLAPQMDPNALAEVRAIEAKKDFSNPRYMELLLPNFYTKHLCRLPEWPDPVNRSFKHHEFRNLYIDAGTI